jgi:hypothetical protein
MTTEIPASAGATVTAATASNAAPALTPRISGAPSGFSVTACMITPDTAELAPTRAPTTARGRRIPWMIAAFAECPPSRTPLMIAPRLSGVGPIETLHATPAANSSRAASVIPVAAE